MDCRTAQEMLEVVSSPDSAEFVEPELAAAAAHWQVCDRCQLVVSQRQSSDRLIGDLCRDIPIPIGLEERLLAAVDDELASQDLSHPPEEPNNRRRGLSRRRMAVIAAGVLCVAAFSWMLLPNSSVSIEALTAEAVERMAEDELGNPFQGTFQPEALFPEEDIRELQSFEMSEYRRLKIPGSNASVAASSFSFKDRRWGTVRGALLVLPIEDVRPRPSATSMAGASTIYQSGFSIKSWQSGGFAYVCLVKGDEARFQRLQRDLRPSIT